MSGPQSNITESLCQCGCGEKPSPGKRYVWKHNFRGRDNSGPKNPTWKGGKSFTLGKTVLYRRGHPRANSWGYVFEHIIIAEKVLGKPLPRNAVVHHADMNPLNNDKSNLVICEDRAYHALLHRRMRSMKDVGNPNLIRCKHCKNYDNLDNLLYNKANRSYYHRDCDNEYRRMKYKNKIIKE